jgi:Ca-activated chloride channel family protein
MNDLRDDPRLTAYALGEVDPQQRREIGGALRADKDLLAEVDAIQKLAERLGEDLAQEPCPELADEERDAIERRARGLEAPGARATGRAAQTRSARPQRRAEAPSLDATPPTAGRLLSLFGFRHAPPRGLMLAASMLFVVGLGFVGLMGLSASKSRSSYSPAAMEAEKARMGADMERRDYDPRMPPSSARPMPSPPAPITPDAMEPSTTESRHGDHGENPFLTVRAAPLSTFGSDVDTASYVAVRNYLRRHTRPPQAAVRLEEMVNYFDYGDAPPASGSDTPFAVHSELGECPWAPKHQLLRVAVKGREVAESARPATNLVFLLDVSGSMNSPRKLPLLKRAFKLLVERLDERDRVAIVVYAGASGLVLPSTTGDRTQEIMLAFDRLRAGGGTAGAAGIELAYQTAVGSFVEGGVNRVILATDGDFNVGPRSQRDLERLIAQKAKSGVFLTVLGFGMNPADHRLERLADRGNGAYAFIDDDREARKVLVEEMTGTLVTIAKDLKLQVEFNPRRVGSYRLLGYENRVLAARDFNDDTKDAGDVGAGHTVTAFYELIPPGAEGVDPLKYQGAGSSDEVCTVKVRFKRPDGQRSALRSFAVPFTSLSLEESEAFRFGSAVVTLGLVLRGSKHKGQANLPLARELAQGALGADREGRRAEFVELVRRAETLYRR